MYPINLGMCRKERKGMSAPGASKGVDNKSTEQENRFNGYRYFFGR
jgi:hypothetical protein